MTLTPTPRIALGFLVLASSGCASAPPRSAREGGTSMAIAEGDPLMAALEKRLGHPDRITGSGRTFLHYDLPGAGTLTLMVSGNQIVGMQHEPLPLAGW